MPLKSKLVIDEDKTLIIWEMTEDYTFFEPSVTFSKSMADIYGKISHPNRKKEWLTSKYIIQSITDCDKGLEYVGGKLMVVGSDIEVSITHNSRYCCVLLSKTRCGIDIEKIDRDFDRVASRYLSDDELEFINNQKLKCVAWCAKEAIYKMVSKTSINFKTDFIIESISENEVGMRYNKVLYKLGYFQHDDCIICYTID